MKHHQSIAASLLLVLAPTLSLMSACSHDDDGGPGGEGGADDGAGGAEDNGAGGAEDGAGGAAGGATGDEYECSDDVLAAPGGAGGAIPPTCEAPAAPTETIEIAGEYVDQYAFDVEITATSFAGLSLSYVDNEAGYALAQTPEDSAYGPCAWNKFVWTEVDGVLYFCQSVFGAESECAAEDGADPDYEDLATGCSGFAWSQITVQ